MKSNYEIPVDMLKEHYWKKHIMIDVHYAKMMNLPVATYKSTSLRSFMLLRSLGENDNQMQILSMWKPKLPRNTLLELEKMKTENEEWTVKTFRELQKRHIKAQEACDIWMKLFHKKPEESPKPLYTSRLPPPPAASSTNSTRESLLSNNGFQSRFKKKCIFCGKGHWSDEYLKYPDIQLRRRRWARHSCKCMKRGDKMKDCMVVGKICVHCGEKDKHHQSLCPEKFSHEVTRKPSDNDEQWRSTEESLTWRSYVLKWRDNHAFCGWTSGDADSNGRSDATRRVYIQIHESFDGCWKQQNLRYRRNRQKIKVQTHKIWQADYLYTWNHQAKRNRITISHLDAEVTRL